MSPISSPRLAQLGGRGGVEPDAASSAASGIGLAIAQRLAAEGAHIVITGRTEARITETKAAIVAQTPGASVQA